jgi:hypothetical protein
MKIALEGITIKVNGLSQRLESIEKVIWAKFKKQHMDTDTISPNSDEEALVNEDSDRFKYQQRKSKSEIYIDEEVSHE